MGSTLKAIVSSGLIVSLGMLLGRISGFFREVSLAKIFGVSVDADIIVLLLTFPDLIIALFIGGAATAVLIPRFQEMDQEQRFSYFTLSSLAVFLVFSVLSLFLYLFCDSLIDVLAPGMSVYGKKVALQLMGLVVWILPVTALISVSRSYLQAHLRFAVTSLDNFIYNTVIILGIIYLSQVYGVKGIVYAIFAGTFLRWFIQLIQVVKISSLSWNFSGKYLNKSLFLAYSQALGAGTILVLLPILARSFASYFAGDGAVSIFNYSYKLTELPFAVVIGVFSTVLFPRFSQLVASKNLQEFRTVVTRSYRYLLFLITPVSMGLIWFFSRLIFTETTVFGIQQEDFYIVCYLAIVGFTVLPLRGLSGVHLSVFSALRDTKTPLIVNASVGLVALPLFYVSLESHGLRAVGWVMAGVYSSISVLEFLILKRKHNINMQEEGLKFRILLILIMNTLIYIFSWFIVGETFLGFTYEFLLAFITGCFCLIVNCFLDKELRAAALKRFIAKPSGQIN